MKIHPTALVAPGVKLGLEVEVGPYAIIEEGAVIGDHCVVEAHASITGFVRMGNNNRVGRGAVIGGDPQDLNFSSTTASEVRIGHDNVFREHVTIHRATTPDGITSVGDQNYFMCGSHLGHDVIFGNRNIVANACLFGGHIHVGDGCVFGGSCVFHQFIRIGDLVMTRGGTAYSTDIPPYTMGVELNRVAGLNTIGLRRGNISPASRSELRKIFLRYYRSGKNLRDAIEDCRKETWGPEASHFLDFVSQKSRRGICHSKPRGGRSSSDPSDSES
jgi:UDP-N-acetylglucosamine acyltransferase